MGTVCTMSPLFTMSGNAFPMPPSEIMWVLWPASSLLSRLSGKNIHTLNRLAIVENLAGDRLSKDYSVIEGMARDAKQITRRGRFRYRRYGGPAVNGAIRWLWDNRGAGFRSPRQGWDSSGPNSRPSRNFRPIPLPGRYRRGRWRGWSRHRAHPERSQ